MNPDMIEGVLTPQDIFNLKVDTQARWDRITSTPNDFSIPAPNFPKYDFTTNPLNQDTQTDLTTGLMSTNPQVVQAAKNTMNQQIMNAPSVKYNTGFTIDTPYDQARKYYKQELGFDPTRDNEQLYYELTYKNKSFFNRRWQDLSKGFGRFIGGVVTKLGQTAGYLGAMAGSGIMEIGDLFGGNNQWMATVADNAFSNWFLDKEQQLKEEWIPVFKPNNWDQKGFFEKLGNGQFWSDEISDGAAFMSEMILTSYLGGELGKVGYLAKLGEATIPGTSAMAKLGRGAMLVGTGAKNFGEVGTWALTVASEAAFEASQGYKDIVKELKSQRELGKNTYTDDQITTIAGDRAATRFRGNLIALGLSNAFENRFIYQPILKKFRGKGSSLLPGPKGVQVSESTGPENFAKAVASRPEYKGILDRVLNIRKKLKDPYGALRFYGSRILASTAVEGFWEENIQLAMERLASTGNLNFRTILPQYLSQTGDALQGKDTENADSIGLGGLMGIFGTTIGSKFNNERRKSIESRDKVVLAYNDARQKYLDFQNVYQKDEKGNLIPDGKGGYKLDAVKLQGILDGINAHLEKQITIDEVEDPIVKRIMQEDLMADFVYAAKKARIFDVVNKRFNALSSATPEDLRNLGFDPNTQNSLPAFNKSFQEQSDIYDETFDPGNEVKPPKGTDVNDDYIATNEQRKQVLYDRRTLIKALERASREYASLGNTKTLDEYAKTGEAIPASSIAQLFNSLQWQKVKLLSFIDSLPKDSKFYSEYFPQEIKRIDAEIERLEPTIQAIADKDGVAWVSNAHGQKVLVAKENYAEYLNKDGTIKQGKENEMFDKFAQDNKDFIKHAELKNSISQNAYLEDKISDKNNGYQNFLDYQDHLDSIHDVNDAVDEAIAPEKPLVPVEVKEEPKETTPQQAQTQATQTAQPTQQTPTAATKTSEKLQKDNLKKLMAAIKANDLSEIDRLSTLAKTYPASQVLAFRDAYITRPGYEKIADKIDEIVKSIVGEVAFNAHVKPPQAPPPPPTEPVAPTPPPTPVVEEPVATLTEAEQTAIAALRTKDFTGTPVEPYVKGILDPNSTIQEKKDGLRGISDQLLDPNGDSAQRMGEALGNMISQAVEALGYPAPAINEGIQEVTNQGPVVATDALINLFADRIAKGEQMTEPEDLQFYENNKEAIEQKLREKATSSQEEPVAEELKELPPTEANEIPPTDNVGTFLPGMTIPAGTNWLSLLIDTAREDGNFIFDGINPKEIEMEGSVPKEKDGRITLKTTSDTKLLRHHIILEKIAKEIATKQDTDPLRFKVKLEILNDENKEWFYQRDEKSNSVIAIIVDENGDYFYFDNKGNETAKGLGTPFGIEYEDVFYTTTKLNTSRNSLGGQVSPSITPNYKNDPAPLMTVVSLLHAKVPVYGSIMGVTAGTLSSLNNNNTLATEQRAASTYKMRTVQELIDAGEIEDQDFDVRIDGFYLDYHTAAQEIQRTKVGNPMLYDVKSDLFIPLTGRKLKNITFKGTGITKGTQLYEIIDALDKKGELSADARDSEGKLLFGSMQDVIDTYNFLKQILYRKTFPISIAGDTIFLNRNKESLKANSIWDAEINYVAKTTGGANNNIKYKPFIEVPLAESETKKGEPLEVELPYEDFMRENFLTGAAKAVITNSDIRFAKLNKRIIFQLDKNYSQLKDVLANGTPIVTKTSDRPEVGDKFAPEADLTKTYHVTKIEDNDITIVEDGTELEQSINVDDLLKRWVKLEKVQRAPEPVSSEKQQSVSKKISSLPKERTKGAYTVTGIIRPLAEDRERKLSPSLVVGSAIDYVAKSIFSDKKVSASDPVEFNGVKATIGSYFKTPANLTEVIKEITRIKNELLSQGYTFKTGVIVSDTESGLSGEIDILLVDPEGVVTIADFKTSNQDFSGDYMGLTYDGVSNRQYFATQGYLYGLMLAKQTGLTVANNNKILGFNISFTDEKNPTDTKIIMIRDSKQHIFNFPNSDIVPFYKKNDKPITNLKEIVDIYEQLKKQNATSVEDNISKRTGKPRKGDGLLMTIADINIIAATESELKANIDHMSEMLGEEFVVRFVNEINRDYYAEWNQRNTTLYKNAIAGTVYHEGWHQFSQLFLTPGEKINMYQSLRSQSIPYVDRTGEYRNTSFDDDLEVEEMLADEWVKYVQNPNSYKFPGKERGILAFFKRMWRALKEWWSGTKNPEQLFKSLYNGNMKSAPRSVDNAIWGKLNSSILNDNGMEILNHSRTNPYIRRTSQFIGEILNENNLSPAWLADNLGNKKIKNLLWDKYTDLMSSRLDKLAIPDPDDNDEFNTDSEYVLANPDIVIQKTVAEKGISPELAAKYIGQLREINSILDDQTGGFDNFYDYYVRNSDIDSIRDKSNENLDLSQYFELDEIRAVNEELAQEDIPDEDLAEDIEFMGDTVKAEHGKGPNEESAIAKSSKRVQDFFKMQGMAKKVNDDDTVEYELDEFDLPETYNWATLFNKTKSELEGLFTIEEMITKLSSPAIHANFPQAKVIFDNLQKYMKRDTLDNFSFIQDFRNVMSLPEVNNVEVVINYDIALEKAANKDTQRTVIKADSISRIGEAEEVRRWEYAFRRPSESRPSTSLTDTISISQVFNNPDKSNILYNVGGAMSFNPFYNYRANTIKMSDQEFLHTIGIDLAEKFWQNADIITFAKRVRSLFIKNTEVYRQYADYQITRDYLKPAETLEEFISNNDNNRVAVEELIKTFFIQNPIQSFRERKTYRMGDKTIETWSLFKAMEDLSRQNSIYSLESFSKSFVAGDGKTKWPFYDLSLITYRTQMLNNINNIRDFNDKNEYAAINPNKAPWMRNSLFYDAIFDDKGERRVISHELKNNDDSGISSQRVKIELADLSSFTTVKDKVYKTVHPKNLNAQDKMFFDTVSLLTNGLIEVPRASTSSTMFAIKLNSYGPQRVGTGFRSQFLPIDLTGLTTSSSSVTGKIYANFSKAKFSALMNSYLTGELQKLRWYFDGNPENRLAKELNIFKDILNPELAKKLIEETTTVSFKDQDNLNDKIKDIVSKNKEEIAKDIREYFATYITDLYKGKKNSNYSNMSSSQKAVLKNLNNLYQNRARSTDKQDIAIEEKIKDIVAEQGKASAHQSLVEKASVPSEASLAQIAAIFAVNQFILNVEYHIWYMGDNYLFSNPFKRGNLTTTTGLSAVVSPHTNHMLNSSRGETLNSLFTGNYEPKDYTKTKTKVLKDVITKSRGIQIMINDRIAYEKQEMGLTDDKVEARKAEILEEIAPLDPKTGERKGFVQITSADGQAKVGLDAYRHFRRIFGTWDNVKDEKEYKRQIAIARNRLNLYFKRDGDKRVALTGDELQNKKAEDEKFIKEGPYSTFAPQKWVHTGPKLDLNSEGNVINSPMTTKFDKMSLHPLIPEALINTGLPDEKLMVEMANEDIDYVKFESVSKGVKHDSISEFFDEFGNQRDDVKLEDATPEWLLSSNVRRQQPTDGEQTENTFGSQQRVMAFDVKYLEEVQNNPRELAKIQKIEDRYLDAVGNVTGFERSQLFNKFGLEESGSKQTYELKIVDQDRFAAAIVSIAKNNNFPENMIQYLQYNPATDKFEYNPSLVFNRKMLLDNIGGIIDRQLRRLKVKGVSAIQVTSVGNTKHPYKNPTEEQIRKYGTNGLHFYHYIYDDKGKIVRTSTMGIKITLQGDFKNLLNLKFKGKKIGTLEKLNEALKDDNFRKEHLEKLTFYGYRIPTNNNNFIDHVEVMEFLPESASNIIIAPMEQITKSGSDFDVDKMQLIFPSIDNEGNLVSLPKVAIEDIYKDINKITSSADDYRSNQKFIKNFITSAKKEYGKAREKRARIKASLEKEFYEIDASAYEGMVIAGKGIGEIIDYFSPFAVDNEKLAKLIRQYDTINKIINDDKLSEVEIKIDRNFQEAIRNLSKYKDYYTNQMISSLKDVMSHPAYLKLLTTPSNSKYLTDLANRIGAMTGRVVNDGLSSSENMKYTAVNTKHGEYLFDAKDIGLYSIQRRWFSLLNYSKVELNRDWKYEKDDMRIHTPLAPRDKVAELGTHESIKLYGDNLDGISPKDIWDQFMTLTIDLPSSTVYTQFGINVLNKKVVQYLIDSRYSVKSVMDFINQPILKEVYDLYNKKVKELADYTLKHALMEVADKTGLYKKLVPLYVEDNKSWKKPAGNKLSDWGMVKDEKTGITLSADKYAKNPGIYANKLMSQEDYFSPEQLENDITTSDRSTQAYKDRQDKILLYFMNVALEASNFTGMQFTFSEDRNKNVNYFTIEENNLKKEKIRGAEFSDIPRDGSMFTKEPFTKLETRSAYSMFTYNKIAQLFYKEFAKEFTDLQLSSTIMSLLQASNSFGIQRQLLAQRIEGDFIEFVYKNFGKFDMNVYDPFSDSMKPSTDRFGLYFMQRIFNIDKKENFKSYGDKLARFVERYPELEERVEFVKRLGPQGILEKNKRDDKTELNYFDTLSANVIRFKRSKENTIQERNFFADQFKNLITFDPTEFKLSKNYTTEDKAKISAFFTELAYLTLYQSGPTNIADNFSDLLPAEFWQEFSNTAFENYKNYTKEVEIGGIKIDQKKRDLLKMFQMLYIENNPKVPWRDNKMIYNLTYFGKVLTEETDRKIARQYKKEIAYFLNFTAGKMYDIKLFADSIEFKIVDDLTC